ncbi:hypothetical protein N9L02_02905 [Gammaproteobacteria bacterium]|nr:hypothetical protein [Gammaproteobacteria bacterium]
MKNKAIIKNYVSEIDMLLQSANTRDTLSKSQSAESQKYLQIYNLRDNPTDFNESQNLWDNL